MGGEASNSLPGVIALEHSGLLRSHALDIVELMPWHIRGSQTHMPLMDRSVPSTLRNKSSKTEAHNPARSVLAVSVHDHTAIQGCNGHQISKNFPAICCMHAFGANNLPDKRLCGMSLSLNVSHFQARQSQGATRLLILGIADMPQTL